MQKSAKKTLSTKQVSLISNVILGLLVVSVGALCIFPGDNALETDGESYSVHRSGTPTANAVSLMFNVYWGTQEVYDILDVLETHNAKATFFIGGCWADDNVECLRAIRDKGHEIGNHGYFHKDHAKLSESQNEQEITDCNRFIELAIGQKPTLFAPPSGAYNNATLTACKRLNMQTILWSKDTIDWRDKDEKLIYSRATKNIKAGDFVLMHPMEKTVEALDDILLYYQNAGLGLVSVSENLQ